MKEKSDTKSLINVKDNIFAKIKKFFLRLVRYEVKDNNTDIEKLSYNNQVSESDDRDKFLNQLKETENNNAHVFNLQKKYENGELKASDMSEEEYSKIKDLYNRQIENLSNQIKIKKAKLSAN